MIEPQPLRLPDDFNPATNMIARTVDGKTYHGMVWAVRLATLLVENGTQPDLEQAEATIRAVLSCQERNESDPHYGNFRWELEDDVVEDLNAVQFALFNLIPIMLRYRDRLSKGLQADLIASIRLGLDEIRRIDVHPAYTNIVIKDITNTCLGGELLGDQRIAERGYAKLLKWMQLTDQNGIPIEFNSPNYARIAIEVLHTLATLVQHPATRMRALVMRNRLALSTVLHIHAGTGRLAGPYSRAYLPNVLAETPSDIDDIREWIATGIVPDWLADLLTYQPKMMQVAETADAATGVGITTYHSPSFALGVASQELTTQSNRFIARQSNVCIAHYVILGQERPGVFFSRYLHNDHWVGDFHSTPSRSPDFLLPEEGRFLGVQDGSRMIGLYAPRELNGWTRCHSAKAALVWLHQESVDEIWISDRRIESLPAQVTPGQTIVVASGQALFSVRPLTLTNMGQDAPLQLTVIDGHLVLELYNYLGPAKTFWELAQPGSFYQGQPQCGFYVEVAERSDYANASAFGEVVARGQIVDEAQARVSYSPGQERLWQVAYERDGQLLGLEIDLLEWRMKRRWNQTGDLGWPLLESPVARQRHGGHITIDDTILTCGEEAAWLIALPEEQLWVAAYHGHQPAPLSLTLPGGRVEVEAMGAGTIVWNKGQVTIEALDLQGQPHIVGGYLT